MSDASNKEKFSGVLVMIPSERLEKLEAENKRLKEERSELMVLGCVIADQCRDMVNVFGRFPSPVATWDKLIGRLAIQDKEGGQK